VKRFLSIIVLTFFILNNLIYPAWATSPTFSNVNIFVASFDHGGINFSANPGTYQTIYTSETTGGQNSRIMKLTASNTDTTTDHVVTCQYKTAGGTVIQQWQSSVPHQTGVIAPVDMKSAAVYPGLSQDNNQNTYIDVHNGDLIQCTYATALTNGAVLVDAAVFNF
jgi:hypothetical protein